MNSRRHLLPFAPLDDSCTPTLYPISSVLTLRRQEGCNRMPALRSQTITSPRGRAFRLQVMLHRDVFEAYVDDRISPSARVHLPGGALAFMARDGTARLSNLRLAHLPIV